MDWFLYDNGLRHEIVKRHYQQWNLKRLFDTIVNELLFTIIFQCYPNKNLGRIE